MAYPARTRTSTASAVFSQLLHAAEPPTKQEVAQALNVSLPTVYQAFNSLEEQGLLTNGSDRTSTGGRRAKTFAIAPEAAGGIGVFATGTSLAYVACDLFGTRFEGLSGEVALEAPCTASWLNARIAEVVAELSAQMERRGTRPAGIGIAVPSAIDPHTERLLNTSVIRLTDDEVHAVDLTRDLPHPAAVFNDANCGAFSQCFPHHERESLIYLSLERGVGGSIFINGEAFGGTRGMSGEFGHICIEPGGKRCACGKRGCLEAYCSTAALSDELGCSLDAFFERVEAGDAEAHAALNVYLDHLARGVQTIHTVLDCPIALGGTMSRYLIPYLGEIGARAAALDPFAGGEPYLIGARHPFHGVPLGAAQQMVDRFIKEL